MTFTVVQEKGQVTIPAIIRKKLGLKKGDLVAFVETNKGIMISPKEIIAMDTLNAIGKALKKKGVTLAELMESGRKIRGDILKEKYDLRHA